jgi:hypothetical protein
VDRGEEEGSADRADVAAGGRAAGMTRSADHQTWPPAAAGSADQTAGPEVADAGVGPAGLDPMADLVVQEILVPTVALAKAVRAAEGRTISGREASLPEVRSFP